MTVSISAHRGHFYNCENGHTFVITEVGIMLSFSKNRKVDDLLLVLVWWRYARGEVPRV